MKNIAFLVTANKTINFYKVSEMLVSNGFDSFWISPSQVWTNWLIKNGVRLEKILNIPEKIPSIDSSKLTKDESQDIAQVEKENQISFRDLYLMDRVLRKKNSNYAYRYMFSCFNEIQMFLIQNNISSIFSEQTWNFEIMATLSGRSIQVDSYYVDSVRVPDGKDKGRFTFYSGYLLDQFPNGSSSADNNFIFANKFLTDYRLNKKGTSYLNAYFSSPSIKLVLLKKFLKHFLLYFKDRHDNTRNSILSLISITLRQLYNIAAIKAFMRFDSIESIKEDYVLIALHKEPDSALDVQSSVYLNQFEAIKAFIRKIPSGYDVVIKDHSHALGLNSLSRYNLLTKLPSVKIVSPRTDIFNLIENAELVFSIGGTVSLEAALMGKRSLTASKKFFSEVLMKESINPYNCSSNEIQDILNSKPPKEEKLINYIAKVHANSYKGMFFDPTKDEIYRSEENINNLYKGFLAFLSKKNTNAN
jgi:hypothetical protein